MKIQVLYQVEEEDLSIRHETFFTAHLYFNAGVVEHSCQHVFSGSEEFMMKFNGKPVLDKCRQMLADVGNYRFVKYRFDRK